MLVEQRVGRVAVVDDRPERVEALTGAAGGGGRQGHIARRPHQPAHERRPTVAPKLVDAAEEIAEGHRLDDGVVGESRHRRVEKGAVWAPPAWREGDDTALLATGLVEVEHGQLGEEAVGLEHLVPVVAEVGGQPRVDRRHLLASRLVGVDEVGPGEREP